MMESQQSYTINVNEAPVKQDQGHGQSAGIICYTAQNCGPRSSLDQGHVLSPGIVGQTEQNRGPRRSLDPGVIHQAPQSVQPACTPVRSNWMVSSGGICMPSFGPQITGGVERPGYPPCPQMTEVMTSTGYPPGGVVSSGSAMPMGFFTPTCTRPPNQYPLPDRIHQNAPSQPVLYAAPPPVQVMESSLHIQTQQNEYAALVPNHYATPLQVQVSQGLGSTGSPQIQTHQNEFATQIPVHYSAPPPVQVQQGLGSSHTQTQRNEFSAHVPVHYSAPLPGQVQQAAVPAHIKIKQNEFAPQVPVQYSAPLPGQVQQAAVPVHNQIQQNGVAPQVPVHYVAPLQVQDRHASVPLYNQQFAAHVPVHYVAQPPVQVQQAAEPLYNQIQQNEFSSLVPVIYATSLPVQVQQASVPLYNQIQQNEFSSQVPVTYAAQLPVEVTQAFVPLYNQNRQNEFPSHVPVTYDAQLSVQVQQASLPLYNQIQKNKFASQVPVTYAAQLPVEVKRAALPLHNQIQKNEFSSKVPVIYAAPLPQVHQASVPLHNQIQQVPDHNAAQFSRQVAPSQYIEVGRPQQIPPVQPPLVPGLQRVSAEKLPTPHYRNQIYRDENQNLFPSSDFVRVTPAEQSVLSMRENSESDEGISSFGESVQTSPHTPKTNEVRKPKRKGRSPAASDKQLKRLLAFQNKLVFEKGLPKSRLQVEFESEITVISPQPVLGLGILAISSEPSFKPSDAMPICSRSPMGDLDGLQASPRNLLSPKRSLDSPPVSDGLKREPDVLCQPVSIYQRPAGTEYQEETQVETSSK